MTFKDLDELNRAHDKAVREMGSAAVVIAEEACKGRLPSDQMLRDYRFARLGVESTRKDLEYCMTLELQEIL